MASSVTSIVSSSTDNSHIPYSILTHVDDKPIGCGSFGTAYKTFHNSWGCQVVYKELNEQSIAKASKADHRYGGKLNLVF